MSIPALSIDVVVLAIVLISALFGFGRGFIREMLALVAWGGAGFLTTVTMGPVGQLIRPYVKSPFLEGAISMVGLFIVWLVVLTLLSIPVWSKIKQTNLRALDRSLGGVYGIFRGWFIAVLLWGVLGYFFGSGLISTMQAAKTGGIMTKSTVMVAGGIKGFTLYFTDEPFIINFITDIKNIHMDAGVDQPVSETASDETVSAPLVGQDEPVDSASTIDSLNSSLESFSLSPALETPSEIYNSGERESLDNLIRLNTNE